MPHERGPSPVLPTEFFCSVLADCNIRIPPRIASCPTLINGYPA